MVKGEVPGRQRVLVVLIGLSQQVGSELLKLLDGLEWGEVLE